MPLVSFEDYQDLKHLVDEFSSNVKASFEGDACKHFSKTATLREKFSIAVSKFLYEFISPRQSMNPKARRLMIFANKTVEPLKRAFGEAALLDALPAGSRNEATAEFVEWLGGKKIAELIRTSMAQGKADSAASSASTGVKFQPL